MKAMQLHYTSCRRGQSGSAGFQVRALSAGILPDEQREIERRGVYRAPRSCRPDPGADEIARDFPLALRSYELASGRLALTRACYVGRDYSGRWGNFFAHTLVVARDPAPTFWPIDFFAWEGWKQRVPPEEDTEDAPAPLPLVDVAAAAGPFGFEDLAAFLRAAPERTALLARMGRALLAGRAASRALVVRDTPRNGLYWIACLQKLFSPVHAAALSTSTYQDDPRACAAINATTVATDFTFEETERGFRFFEFDLTTGVHSEVAEAADDYPAVAARWMAEEPALLPAFYAFLDLFDHRELDPALISAARLFELSRGETPPLGGASLAAMIGFASRHARPAGRTALIEVLGGAVRSAGGLAAPEDYAVLIRFLVDGARTTGRAEHRALAFAAWTSLVRDHLIARGAGLGQAEAVWSVLRGEMDTYGDELAAAVLAEPMWRAAASRPPGLPSAVLVFLLRLAWTCLDLARRLPPWEQPEVAAVVAALGSRCDEGGRVWHAVLAEVPAAPEALVCISRRLRDAAVAAGRDAGLAGREVGRALGERLQRVQPAAAAAAVRRGLADAGEWDLLFGEWLHLVDSAADREGAFNGYRRAVLGPLAGYEAACFDRIAAALLDRLPADRQSAQSLVWLRGGEVDRLAPKLAAQCVRHANRSVDLDPAADGDGAARLVAAAADRLGVELRPDRPLLRRVWKAALAPRSSFDALCLSGVAPACGELPQAEQIAFVQAFLVPALELAGSMCDHRKVLLAVVGSRRPDLVCQRYLAFFAVKRKAAWPESLHAALRFWLAADRAGAGGDDGALAALAATAGRGLAGALVRLKPEEAAGVERRLRKAGLDACAERRWEDLRAAVDKRRRSPWRLLASLLRR
jgi:hypothetical protein